jgi:hypothetical protein
MGFKGTVREFRKFLAVQKKALEKALSPASK